MPNVANEPAPLDRSAILPPTNFQLDRRLSVAEQVYRLLRHEIVMLHFLPGASISESTLCRKFGVSRTPIRAAIQLLVEEGLVDVFPNQGSFVAPIRLTALQDSQFVRLAVEVALLKDVAGHWSPEHSATARESVARQRVAIAADDVDACQLEDERFHRLLSVFAERPGVWPTIVSTTTRLARFMRLCGTPDRRPVAAAEHEAVVDALDRSDLPGAEAALAFHIGRNFELVDTMKQRFESYFVD
ncbi:MAG: GntR family transcriptional regulator [Rhizobiaceae bacterium]|nr:GntR family transcriptional regulator [Rhizobiaceae bacterium]